MNKTDIYHRVGCVVVWAFITFILVLCLSAASLLCAAPVPKPVPLCDEHIVGVWDGKYGSFEATGVAVFNSDNTMYYESRNHHWKATWSIVGDELEVLESRTLRYRLKVDRSRGTTVISGPAPNWTVVYSNRR